MENSVLAFKKISRKCRKILAAKQLNRINVKTINSVKSFRRINDIPELSDKKFQTMLGSWNKQFLRGRFRMFLFKFFNNTLPINTRTSHFAENATRLCTFCVIKNYPILPDESFAHLFFSCSVTRKWQRDFLSKHAPMLNLDIDANRKLRLTGSITGEDKINTFLFYLVMCFQQKI